MDSGLPAWRSLLKAARQKERQDSGARWLQLSTVARDGTPRIRTLVFRNWVTGNQFDLFSDQRSDKFDELTHRPDVELCWMLMKARQQFRLRGCVKLFMGEDSHELRQKSWMQISPQGRSVWAWPHPGFPLQPNADFPESVHDEIPMPEHFIVLRVMVSQVEMLDLRPHPHQRIRWSAENNWREQRLNP